MALTITKRNSTVWNVNVNGKRVCAIVKLQAGVYEVKHPTTRKTAIVPSLRDAKRFYATHLA